MSTGLAVRASTVIVAFLVTLSFGCATQSIPLAASSGSPRIPVLKM
jgi:hypothetical protein